MTCRVLTEHLSPTVPQAQGTALFFHLLSPMAPRHAATHILVSFYQEPLHSPASCGEELGETEPAETLITHTYQWLTAETWETLGYCFALRNSSPKRASLYHSSIGAASQPQSPNLHIPQLSSGPDGYVSQALGDTLKVVCCSPFPKGRSEKQAPISPLLWE